MSAQHTYCLPLRVSVGGAVVDDNGHLVAVTANERRTETEFRAVSDRIVRACNAHDDMLAALEAIKVWGRSRDGSPEADETALREIVEITRAAIAKARGQA